MISGLSIFFMVISLLLAVGFPIALIIYMYKKYRISIKAVLVGALMFFIFQIILRIPALTYIQLQPWYTEFASKNMIVTLMIIAFTAGLFETVGRYLGLRYLLRKNLDWKNGIAYGIGHGGIESILLVGINFTAAIVMSILINSGKMSSTSVPQLISTPSFMYLAGGVERLFTIMFHIAMAVLVTFGILKKKASYILLCVLLHTALDTIIPLMNIKGINVWILESAMAVAGIISLIYIIKSKINFEMLLPDLEHSPSIDSDLKKQELTPESKKEGNESE